MKTISLLVLLLLPYSVLAHEPAASARQEIQHLIDFINRSSCHFNRNGSWYSANEAAAHLDKKYHSAMDKDRLHSAEDFIEYVATKSSMTNTPYKVQCQGQPEIHCAPWLTAQLMQMRQQIQE
jgi:hypothetical protein